jgi:hypothetical protein
MPYSVALANRIAAIEDTPAVFERLATSTCPLRKDCERFEVNAASHCVFRTYADFSEELIGGKDNRASCRFFIEKTCALQQNAA